MKERQPRLEWEISGEHFIRTWDGYVLVPVFDVALAEIFEIGRITLKRHKKEWKQAMKEITGCH